MQLVAPPTLAVSRAYPSAPVSSAIVRAEYTGNVTTGDGRPVLGSIKVQVGHDEVVTVHLQRSNALRNRINDWVCT